MRPAQESACGLASRLRPQPASQVKVSRAYGAWTPNARATDLEKRLPQTLVPGDGLPRPDGRVALTFFLPGARPSGASADRDRNAARIAAASGRTAPVTAGGAAIAMPDIAGQPTSTTFASDCMITFVS